MSTIFLLSKDGETIEVEKMAAMKSQVIKNIIEDNQQIYANGNGDEIPIGLSSKCLKKVMQYCKYHQNDEPEDIPKPLKSSNLAEMVSEFDAKYIDIDDLEDIFEIIEASNYLEIKKLSELSCAKIATLIKGKSPEEIRATFNIKNDFDEEEEQQIKEENKWAEIDI